jgi:hypothetical protein
MHLRKCLACGSERMVPNGRVLDQEQYSRGCLLLSLRRVSNALLFKKPFYDRVRAWVCGECGYVQLFAENPRQLYQAHLERRGELAP